MLKGYLDNTGRHINVYGVISILRSDCKYHTSESHENILCLISKKKILLLI